MKGTETSTESNLKETEEDITDIKKEDEKEIISLQGVTDVEGEV